jgi:hypothetical protein
VTTEPAISDCLDGDTARLVMSPDGRRIFLANLVQALCDDLEMSDVKQRVIGTAARICKVLDKLSADHTKTAQVEKLSQQLAELRRQIEEGRSGRARASSAPRFVVPTGAGAARQ